MYDVYVVSIVANSHPEHHTQCDGSNEWDYYYFVVGVGGWMRSKDGIVLHNSARESTQN